MAVVYCYLSKDVRAAFRRVYRRFMARRNANMIRRRTNPRNTSSRVPSGVIVEHPLNTRNHRRKAALTLRIFQLCLTNCNDSCNSNPSNSRSHSSCQRPSRISNSPSENTLCMSVFPTNRTACPPVFPSTHSINSSASQSFCRISTNGSNNITVKYHRLYSSYTNSAYSSSLGSPEHPCNSGRSCTGVVAAAEMLGSKPHRKNILGRVSIPMRELNERWEHKK